MNCRNYDYYTVCDISMCCSMCLLLSKSNIRYTISDTFIVDGKKETNKETIANCFGSYNLGFVPNIRQNGKCLSVLLELSKAFDTISHDILTSQLSHYGVRGTPLNWFNSYLCNRTQYVSYKGTKSECSVVTLGVLQGSVLRFIQMTYQIKHSKKILFADDITMYATGNNSADLFEKVNETFLISLTDSEQTNSQSMPVKQSICLYPARTIPQKGTAILKIDDDNLDQVTHIKLLGLLLDQHLCWDQHIQYCVAIGRCCIYVRILWLGIMY